jgi:hypothetical protein
MGPEGSGGTRQRAASGGRHLEQSEGRSRSAWVSGLVGSLSGDILQNRACVILFVPEGVLLILLFFLLYLRLNLRDTFTDGAS